MHGIPRRPRAVRGAPPRGGGGGGVFPGPPGPPAPQTPGAPGVGGGPLQVLGSQEKAPYTSTGSSSNTVPSTRICSWTMS